MKKTGRKGRFSLVTGMPAYCAGDAGAATG